MSDELSPATEELLQQLSALDIKKLADAKFAAELDHAIIDALPHGKVVINNVGIIVRVNKAAELAFGYSRDELVGRPVEILVPDSAKQAHVTHRENFRMDSRMRPMGFGLNAKGRRKNASEFGINVMLSPFMISTGHYTLAIIRPDIPELSIVPPLPTIKLVVASEPQTDDVSIPEAH